MSLSGAILKPRRAVPHGHGVLLSKPYPLVSDEDMLSGTGSTVDKMFFWLTDTDEALATTSTINSFSNLQTIYYTLHTQETEEGPVATSSTVNLFSYLQTIFYKSLVQPDEDGPVATASTVSLFSNLQTIFYVSHDQPNEDGAFAGASTIQLFTIT